MKEIGNSSKTLNQELKQMKYPEGTRKEAHHSGDTTKEEAGQEMLDQDIAPDIGLLEKDAMPHVRNASQG
jgi:hypothetical protein